MALRLSLCSKLLRTDSDTDDVLLPKVTAFVGLEAAIFLLAFVTGTSAVLDPPMTTSLLEPTSPLPLQVARDLLAWPIESNSVTLVFDEVRMSHLVLSCPLDLD